MIGWIDFFIVLFWLSLGLFFLQNHNVVSLLLYAELTWLILFVLSTVIGSQINEILSMSFTFFILGFGGLEFVVGLMLIVLLKNSNVSLIATSPIIADSSYSNFITPNSINTKPWNL